MTKLESSVQGVNVALLYLYNALLENGYTSEDAKKEASEIVLERMKQLGYLNQDIKIDSNKIDVIKKIYEQVELLVDSNQPYISQQGKYLAQLVLSLLTQ